ncbi:hypothetical protein PHG31p4 [Aeromonas phage 31]|uniref:Uncharacterized protein PHG31ORF004c n=1 Tax=Aeromonas phage 31 TaxID=321023 RepID=Q56F07_9CAUD|nr:goF mRNA metabolism modulator [Aeromonas phage 31]AAX63493.1 hypothetical protein PHG31p4 [Aeromonas phage 31]APU00899.1 hypothetical protein [Aeromonas phage 31.2]APU01805.1 hypothetical protein [Aeromonas phage L9-6]
MKAKFKSVEAKRAFIDQGEKEWATNNSDGSNNNWRIAKKFGMGEFDVKPLKGGIFDGWHDIYINGDLFDSISASEAMFFDFRDDRPGV